MKKILIVAYHFPPQAGSSGLLRSLKFSRYLPGNGWQPVVLTVNARAYERVDDSQLDEIPATVPVHRSFALDTRRHLSWRGKYFRFLTLPDRWVSWCLAAVPAGLRLIRQEQVDVIFTTFPIPTAVLIGLVLHRLTAKPWVVDFRDSMTEDHYPRDPLTWRVCRWLEKQAVRRGSFLLFTADSARIMYLSRYPHLRQERCLVLPNGYDEADFEGLPSVGFPPCSADRPLRLVHSGLIYPEERDPRAFFRALARLKNERRIAASKLRIDLRASGNEGHYAEILRSLQIDDLVRLLPALPYHESLRDSVEADGLLLLQAASCNHQIPAKAYEYIRLGKPILALTDSGGDTAALLRRVGGTTSVDLADEEAIYQMLPSFLESVGNGSHPRPDVVQVSRFSRKGQSQQLALHLDKLVP